MSTQNSATQLTKIVPTNESEKRFYCQASRECKNGAAKCSRFLKYDAEKGEAKAMNTFIGAWKNAMQTLKFHIIL